MSKASKQKWNGGSGPGLKAGTSAPITPSPVRTTTTDGVGNTTSGTSQSDKRGKQGRG